MDVHNTHNINVYESVTIRTKAIKQDEIEMRTVTDFSSSRSHTHMNTRMVKDCKLITMPT